MIHNNSHKIYSTYFWKTYVDNDNIYSDYNYYGFDDKNVIIKHYNDSFGFTGLSKIIRFLKSFEVDI